MNNPNKSTQTLFREDVAYLETLKTHPRQAIAEALQMVIMEHKIIHRPDVPEPVNSGTQTPPTIQLKEKEKGLLGLTAFTEAMLTSTSTTTTSQ